MPANPEPPHDSEEATSYAAGDAVYFLRHGTSFAYFQSFLSIGNETNSTPLGQWRAGVVVGLGGSSDDSPRYMVLYV